jgi:hypothetical protein
MKVYSETLVLLSPRTTRFGLAYKMLFRIFLLAFTITTLISCSQDRKQQTLNPETDRAVITAALRDFAGWKDVTFGELEGVLELSPSSEANPDATIENVKSLALNIEGDLDKEIVTSFIERNKSTVSIAHIVSELPWSRLEKPNSSDTYTFAPPDGAKARGSLTMPGYSADRSKALLQIHHSWSMHGAIVTYVLSNKTGTWQVTARDQVVFL